MPKNQHSQSLLSFVFKPAVSHRDILSLCDERSLSIPITEFNHIGTILQICLQLCSTALMFPYKADPGSFTAYFDPAFFRERRAGIPESQQLQLLLYNRLTQTTAYLCCRQICPICGLPGINICKALARSIFLSSSPNALK